MSQHRVKLLLELNALTRKLGDGDLSRLIKFAESMLTQKEGKKGDRTESREERQPPVIKASEAIWRD